MKTADEIYPTKGFKRRIIELIRNNPFESECDKIDCVLGLKEILNEFASQLFKSTDSVGELKPEPKDTLIKYLESEADKFQKDGGNSEYFAGGIRYAAHLLRLDGTDESRQPIGIAHLIQCQQKIHP